jgi:hypothetical protein
VTTSELHAAAGVPVQFRCIRLRLLPLTIGHVETLERMGCMNPTDIPTLSLGVMICALPHDRFARFIAGPWLRLALWVWRKTAGQWDFDAERWAFVAYLNHEMSGPPFSRSFGSGEAPRSVIPTSRYLSVFLCSRLGHDPERVRGYRFRDALWDHYTLAEMDGRGSVEEMPYDDRVAAMEAALPPDDVMIAAARKAFGK